MRPSFSPVSWAPDGEKVIGECSVCGYSVEWLRSCFRSKWRVIRGSDRLRDGFYYFSPEGTPHYPGRHNLWSRDWTSDDRDVEPLLGEWKGARQWHRGDPPLRRPLPVLVGKTDCIEFGERPDLVRIPEVSAACAPVLPEACYAAEDTLRFKTNVTDCVFAQVSAKIIAAAYDDLAAAEILAFEFLGPDSIIRSFPQPSETLLAGVIGIVGDTAILWLTGTTTNWQLAVQGFYFGYGPVDQGCYSCSVLYEQAALATAAEIVTAGAGEATRIVLTGHSYGGAAAQVLAARMIVANPDREVELLTLGAPSAGDIRLYRLIEDLPQTHWVNEFDPIPFLPPNNTRFVDLLGLAALPLRFLWSSYVRPPFSRVITEDGRLVEMSKAELPDSSIVKLVLKIIAGSPIPYVGAHNLKWYIYRLCQACKCIARPCVEPGLPTLNFEVTIGSLVFNHAYMDFTTTREGTLEANDTFDAWYLPEGFDSALYIYATRDDEGDEDYLSFKVILYWPNLYGVNVRFEWQIDAADMLAGIDTVILPDMFGTVPYDDHVISLSTFRVIPFIS